MLNKKESEHGDDGNLPEWINNWTHTTHLKYADNPIKMLATSVFSSSVNKMGPRGHIRLMGTRVAKSVSESQGIGGFWVELDS